MTKRKIRIKFLCSKCGKEPVKNGKESNGNWDVYNNKPCQFCGGKIKPKIVES